MDKESKNKSKKLIIITVALLLAIITIFNYNSSYAIENETYTREEMQDMIVSTAMSYFQNNYYSDYGQKALDYLGVTENYYYNSTVYWRDLNVTPEMAGRSNYYHIDCSGFTFITYLNTLGYDMSEYSDINSYMLFYQANTYKMRRVNDYSDTLTYHRAAYKRFGQAWNNGFLAKVANKISDTCTTSACSTSSKTGIVYDNLDNSKTTELAYYYVVKETDTLDTVNAAYNKIKNSLLPGDIIAYNKDDSTGDSSGHVMLYIGQAPGSENPSLLHSTGSDYNTEETSEKNQLRKKYSIIRSVADTYVNGRFQSAYDAGGDVNFFAVFRPINTVCKSDSVCKASYNSNNVELTETQLKNNKARVELKSLRKEQYMTQNKNYNTSLNPTTETKDGNTTNVLSKFNSINIGDEITYNLRLTNKYDSNTTGLTITAKVPEGSTYVTGSCNYGCTISNGTITWENQTISDSANSNGTYKTYKYTVTATKEGTLKNEGMLITTSEGNELQMSSLSITVKPTQNGINKEILMTEINKFQKLVKEGKITYSSSGSRTQNIKDLDTLTSASISQLGFIKSIYYNAFNLDLDMLEGAIDTMNSTKIKNGIFKKMAYPATKNDGTEYTGDTTTNVYARLLSSETSALTGIEANINKMLVPGMFGGRQMKGNDTNTRIKFLRSFKNDAGTQSDLEPGDIIVTYYSNAASINSWLYLGTDENGPVLARFESDGGLVIYTDEHLSKYYSDTTLQADTTKKPTNQILNEIFSQNLFVVLRPSRLGTTVSYNYNGGIEGTNSYVAYNTYKNLVTPIKNSFTTKLEYNKTISGATTSFTRTNTFDGWSYNGTIVEDETTLQTTENHTLKAEWNIKSIELPSLTVAGYTLEGWYSDSALTKKTGNAGASYTPESNGTLYAKWKANEYQIKYNANGGVGTMTNSSHTYDVEKKLTANTFTREGYTFAGWSTTSNGNVIYQDNVNIKNLASSNGATVNLYAIWEEASETEAIITVKVENGTIDKVTQTVNYNESATFTLTPNKGHGTPSVTCTNNQTGTIENNILKIDNVTANTTCDVTFKANTYEVKYNANNGTGTMENSSHTYGISKELSENKFTRNGYTFSGWSTEPNGEITYVDKENVRDLTEENNKVINLYAVWKIENYTIKYNLDGGEVTNPESYNIETNTFKLNNPVKEGYVFTGWTGSNGSAKEKDVTITKGTTGNKEYTANFEEAKYKIAYKSDENGTITGIKSEEVTYKNSPQGTTSKPNEGYQVLKWSIDKDVTLKDGTKILKGAPITEEQIKNIVVTEDLVITIYHYKIKYSITYESSENGTISGIESEEVSYGENPLGTENNPNKGYVLAYYVADKDVTLTTGEVIKANSPITEDDLSKIIVKENIKITAIYEIAKYKVTYETDGNGTITGIKEETKKYQENPSGTTTIPNKNYELLKWTGNKEVTLKDGTKIAKGDVITEEEIKEIILESDLILTAHHIKTTFTVYYKNDEGTNITGILKEELKEGESLKVTTVKTDNLNSSVIFKGNKDVTLKDGTVIKQGNVIKPEQLTNIIVKEDLILTAYELKNSSANVNVPDTGSNKSLLIIATGIALISLGGYVFYKRKSLNK